MVNNLLANGENEKETISGNDENGNGHILSGCSSNDDINPYKSYARRRKCNENIQVCEKQKKRESYQRVSRIFMKIKFDMNFSWAVQIDWDRKQKKYWN